MKARPILFSGPMVRALLAGRKTQTRRIVKPQPPADFEPEVDYSTCAWFYTARPVLRPSGFGFCDQRGREYKALGGPGDLLWVRETWTSSPDGTIYRATADEAGMLEPGDSIRWRPSIFMPRWASRLTLRITDVRVERLQDISEDDARAEGVRGNAGGDWGCEGLIEDFAALWDSINGAGAWDANPWVWAYTFEVIRKNVDAVLAEMEEE